MPVNTTHRSDEPEIMDNFSMEGEILRDALDKIASINRLLGGNKVTLQGLKWLINHKASLHKETKHIPLDKTLSDSTPAYKTDNVSPETDNTSSETDNALSQTKDTLSELTILDVGCGNGDMLRALADYASKNRLRFNLIGIDANNFTINYAKQLSINYPNISYICADIFEEIKQDRHYDVILCTLTLHHFKDHEIIKLLEGFKTRAKMGIIVNDLHRNAMAYYLFMAVCFVFGLNKMSRDDGLTSILRGFKKEDLQLFSEKLNFKNYVLKWKWAFRYQWVISTLYANV